MKINSNDNLELSIIDERDIEDINDIYLSVKQKMHIQSLRKNKISLRHTLKKIKDEQEEERQILKSFITKNQSVSPTIIHEIKLALRDKRMMKHGKNNIKHLYNLPKINSPNKFIDIHECSVN